jgi:hypothetical protein
MALARKFPKSVSCADCTHAAAIHGTRDGKPEDGAKCHAKVHENDGWRECLCTGYQRRKIEASPVQPEPKPSRGFVDAYARTRKDDYATSIAAARTIEGKAPNQKLRMLMAFSAAGDVGYTDEEAAIHADLDGPRVCFWKRAGELREDAMIKLHPVELEQVRKGSSGVIRHVWVITALGRKQLKAKGLA